MTPTTWRDELDERQLKEIELAQFYASKLSHGTDGHHRLLLIAKMVEMLVRLERSQPE